MSSKQHPTETKLKHVLVNRNCIALVLTKIKTDAFSAQVDGHVIFADFLQQNSMCFWNACLMRSVASLEYRGCLVPTTLLISGTNFALEVIRSAWARRVLRPPKGYTISKLGDVGTVDMHPVPQTQFAPLSEALCKVVADLNSDHVMATTGTIRSRLENSFPEMQVPCEDILHKTLGGLIRERKIYHTGMGYFVVSPDTYRQRAVSPLCERQMLMTNEEAIVKLHGDNRRECSLAVQVDEMDIAAAWKCSTSSFLHARQGKNTASQSTQVPSSPDLQLLERSHSFRVLRVKGRPKGKGEGMMDRGGSFKESKKIGYLTNDLDGDLNDMHKNEKQSMLAKILKRMQFLSDRSAKHVVFSAQFPPLEWLDSNVKLCHSVATQTHMLLNKVVEKPTMERTDPTGSKIPWDDSQNMLDNKLFSHYTSPIPNQRRFYKDLDGSSQKKNLSLPMRPNNSRYSPTHRYSYGTFTNYTKRRHKHRRSSSESPKVQKTLKNGYHSFSTSSKSNADNSEDKTHRSSSSGSVPSPALKEPKLRHSPRFKGTDKNPGGKCISSSLNPSSREESILHTPQSSLEREVLKDMKNISTVHNKSTPTKVANTVLNGEMPDFKQEPEKKNNTTNKQSAEEKPTKLSKLNETNCNEKSVSYDKSEDIKPDTVIRPLVLKGFVDIPKPKLSSNAKSLPKEIIIDNSVSVEVALEKSPSPKLSKPSSVSTTIVTEETTVTNANGNSKVITVTSVTTSMSHSGLKDMEKSSLDQSFDTDVSIEKEKSSVNDLNIDTEKAARIIDCSSSCNIVTEVK